MKKHLFLDVNLTFLYILFILILVSCHTENESKGIFIEPKYPKTLEYIKTDIKNFIVYTGTEDGGIENIGKYTPFQLWDERINMSPLSITFKNDSILKFDEGNYQVYKLSNDTVLVRNSDNTWKNIGYYELDKFIYHFALVYYCQQNDISQSLLVENSCFYLDRDNFFAIYPFIILDDLKLEKDKVAWCNIYSQYLVTDK